MKKLIIFIILLFPINVYALDIYSNEYYLEGENNSNFPFKSEEFIEKESNYSFDAPEEKLNRVIFKEEVSGYRSLEKINTILIKGFNSIRNNVYKLTEIKVYYKNELIDYKASCINCSGYAEWNFSNDRISDTDGTLNGLSLVYLYLGDYYNPEDIRVDISFYMRIALSFEMYWYKDFYYKMSNISDFDSFNYIVFKEDITSDKFNVLNEYMNTFSYSLNDKNIINYKWDKEVVIDKDFNYYIEDKVLAYKYVDKLYKYYMVVKDKKEINDIVKTEYKDRVIYEEKEMIKENSCNNSVSIREKIVEKNSFKETFFYKYRYICAAIILLTLFLLGYMLYALIKE